MNNLICEVYPTKEHNLIRDEKESTTEREVWYCLCGYMEEEFNDSQSGG